MSKRVSLDMQTIVQVAADWIDRNGLESLSLASLAQQLGIRSPSLYNHITGLPGLRTEIAIHGCDRLNSVLTRAAVGRSGDVAVRSIAQTYLDFARTHPGLYEAVERITAPEDPRWRQATETLVNTVVQVFQHYGISDEEAIHAVRGFRSLVHGFSSLEQNGGFRMAIDLDRSFLFLIDTFLRGLHSMEGE